jgi:AAA domain
MSGAREPVIVGLVKGKVIEFWRAVEMFSPPAIPEVRISQRVFEVGPGRPLPWERGHPLRHQRLPKERTWRHVVYVGIYPRENVFTVLGDVFPAQADSFDERPSGSSALLAFAVSGEGIMLEDSAVLSACAWATARAHDPGPGAADWLDGFSDVEADFARQLEEIYLLGEDGQPEPTVLDWAALAECLAAASAAIGVAEGLGVEGIRVRSESVLRRSAEIVDHDFLNSFIADDLARVADAAARGEVGSALCDYLRPTADLETGARVDVRTQLDEVRSATGPECVPLGRWPASPDHPLALGQQLAVNEAVAMEGAAGRLFAVNGPPGTGKTTMLRDLVAALVTERAGRLAALADPLDAFLEEPERWKTARYQRTIHRLRPELTGFELVVASSNNGAVENLTLEIPSDKAVDGVWREPAHAIDYFPALAERAMGAGQDKRGARGSAEAKAWGLVAARLGNSMNRKGFVKAVWWTESSDDDDRPPPPIGLRDLLKAWEKHREGPSWGDAVASFQRAHHRAAGIRDERLRVRAQLDRLGELESEIEMAREAERAAGEKAEASRQHFEQLKGLLRTHEEERERRVQEREDLRRLRPPIFRLWARAEWRDHDRQLAAGVAKIDARLSEDREEALLLEEEVQALTDAEAAVAVAESERDKCQEVVSEYDKQAGASLPDSRWLENRETRELRAPWSDAEWNEARSELFLAALALHKAFLVHAAQPMRESLDGAMEILTGNAPRDLSAEAALAAWQALFMLVPMVSTTFASVSRLFGPLAAEALGWLLADEAGQATPQNAVGALWRSQRAVIVGDPLQLEPITTIPFEAEQAIRTHYGVGEEWLTGRGSVQSLADRLNRFGTALPGADGRRWVGAPLAVHRRCDRPMFDISNQIAYDGLMIEATDPTLARAFAASYPMLPQSKWIDVRSEISHGHWIPAEGDEVDRILAHLGKIEFHLSQVMAISPFRDVAQPLRERADANSGLRAGTIHTAQGKEADIVILVLGSDPAREGARVWAAERPNLLNVAVSRAKRRLYVIGDREAWMRQRHFDVLAERLPHDDSRR